MVQELLAQCKDRDTHLELLPSVFAVWHMGWLCYAERDLVWLLWCNV